MKELVEKMNDVLSAWKTSFDITTKVKMAFRLSEENKLYLNEHEIHIPNDLSLSLSSVDFNAENVKFYFEETKRVLAVGIKWPEDSVPEVDTIQFGFENEM